MLNFSNPFMTPLNGYLRFAGKTISGTGRSYAGIYQGNYIRIAGKTIPYGETLSYQTMAQQIGKPKAVRAVGTANGANRIAIIIPCHRVIGKDGRLTGSWRRPWNGRSGRWNLQK